MEGLQLGTRLPTGSILAKESFKETLGRESHEESNKCPVRRRGEMPVEKRALDCDTDQVAMSWTSRY